MLSRATHRRSAPKVGLITSVLLWILSPWFRYRVRKLEGFAGPETYTAQMQRQRRIALLKTCLTH